MAHTRKCNVVTRFQQNSVETNRKIAESLSLGYAVMLLNLKGDINIGTMIRTSCIFGASKVYVVGRRYYDRRMEVGANNYISVEKFMHFHENLLDILSAYSPICVEQGGKTLDEFSFNKYLPPATQSSLIKPPCFIFGAEDTGISRTFLNQCLQLPNAECISIPQLGILRSLNVAVAHGIVLSAYVSAYRNVSKKRMGLIQ